MHSMDEVVVLLGGGRGRGGSAAVNVNEAAVRVGAGSMPCD